MSNGERLWTPVEALLLGDGRDLVPARTGQGVAIAEEMAAGGEFACRAVNVAMLPYAEAGADGRGDCSDYGSMSNNESHTGIGPRASAHRHVSE
jgi:hypothetical protein